MSESKKVGPELIVSILSGARNLLTTRELQQEVHKVIPFCGTDNIVVLNLIRLTGMIKGKLSENRTGIG